MICVRVRCCILTIGSSETILVKFVKNNLKLSALCELSPKATSPAKKVRFVVHVDFVSFDVVCRNCVRFQLLSICFHRLLSVTVHSSRKFVLPS